MTPDTPAPSDAPAQTSADAGPAQRSDAPPAGAAAGEPSFLAKPMASGLVLVLLAALALGLGALLVFHPWETPEGPQGFRQDVASRLAALDERVAALEMRARTETTAADGLAARLAALEAKADQPPPIPSVPTGAPPDTAVQTALDGLAARLAALEAAPVPQAGAAPPGKDAVTALTDRLAGLEAQRSLDGARLEERLQALERGLAETLPAKLAGLEQGLATRPTGTELAAVTARLAALERLDSRALARRAALAVATGALADAVRAGEPFAGELALVTGLLPGDPALPRLERQAARGVARTDTLAREFAEHATALRQAEAGAVSGGSGLPPWLARYVTVTRETPDAPRDLATGLAAIETVLAAGDVAEALRLSEKLPGDARTVLAGWIDRATARADALAALNGLQTRVLDGLQPHAP